MTSSNDHPPARPAAYLKALAFYDSGRLRDALHACIGHLGATSSPYPATLALLGSVLLDSGHAREAAHELARAVSLDDGDASAWVALAQAHVRLHESEQARAAIAQALHINSLDININVISSGILVAAGDVEGALTCGLRATELDPQRASAWFNLALALQANGQADAARDAAGRASSLDPADAATAGLAAELTAESGDIAGARALLAAALLRHPQHFALLMEAGWLANRAADLAGAADAYARALLVRPTDGAALSQLLFCRKQTLNWQQLSALQQRFRKGVANQQSLLTPFSFLSDPSTRAEQRRCAQTWGAGAAPAPMFAETPVADGAQADDLGGRRLRVGYLSGDFYDHPTAVLLAGVLECHDRSRFEVFAYSTGPTASGAMRARIASACEHFADIRDRRPDRVAARIAADRLDVLVDLKGYTEGAPTAALALRPAPVQAHWIGYPGTLAAPFIDYLFADRIVAPPEHGADYSEALVWLPDAYQPNDRARRAAPSPTRAALGLDAASLVFVSFNAAWKLGPDVFDAWARIMAATPASQLWLLARDDTDPVIANARRELAERGIAPDRIVFAMRCAQAEYLALYARADIFLDTWPYNAHTTAADALWMGCPLVTWLGDTFAGRVGASLARAVGMDALVAADVEGYVASAIALANDPQQRALVRSQLAQARTQSPLFDAAAMARHIEYAYTRMAAQKRSGQRESFDVPRG